MSLFQEQPVLAITTAATALLALHAVLSFKKGSRISAYQYLRPASTLPILGNTLDASVYQDRRIYDWIAEQCDVLGWPWLFTVPDAPPIVMVTTPELFEDVMKTQLDVFEKGEEEASYMRDVFGQRILNSDGKEWYFHHKTASNLFSLQMMQNVMHEAVREKLKVFCDVLSAYASRQQPTSLKSTIIHFTSDALGKIGFGVDLNCLQTGLLGKPGNEFIEAFSWSTRQTYLRFQQPRWLWEWK
uniref:Cytochrome P450 n=1 Tax=Globisporangium ultimum (strain ATCC 200006 / CBS 805.95 / DAOM BR144) TaxID=431595 RepID=K3WNI4_GLOUD